MKQGTAAVEIPAALYEQMRHQEPKMTEWGVRVTFRKDRTSRAEFPGTTEAEWFGEGSRRFVRLTLREPGHPVDLIASWSFDASFFDVDAEEQQ